MMCSSLRDGMRPSRRAVRDPVSISHSTQAECVNVGTRVRRLACALLRRHVGRRTHHHSFGGERRSSPSIVASPKSRTLTPAW